MKVGKKSLINLERCYAVSTMQFDGETRMLFATEGKGACYMFSGENLTQSTVWDGPGGTMSIVPIPCRKEFLAVQNFFPTFQSENAAIVWGSIQNDNSWEVKTILKLPYVHRFDILSAGGINYFLGATLCTSKKDKDDWSDPGKVYVGVLPDDLNKPIEIKPIIENLTKNHGYCRSQWKGKMAGFITAEEGVFVVTPPEKAGGNWEVEKIIDRPVSDIALCDIDGDGVDEIATIESFHGTEFCINKRIGNDYVVIYKYENPIDFGHVVWGGTLRGVPTFIGGCRRLDKELFCIQCSGRNPLTFKTCIIEKNIGPSNITVMNEKDHDIILSANREIGEAAIYKITD